VRAALWGQAVSIQPDHLKDKSSDHVEVSLNSSTLQFAARFMDGKDPDEAKVKKLIMGIEGIYIRSFEFKNTGAWSAADLDRVRTQLKAPEWSKIVGVKSNEDGENIEIWLRTEKGKVSGVAILASEPRELTVVNLVATSTWNPVADLGGHFGLPKIPKKK
jgi:hypothetical protein